MSNLTIDLTDIDYHQSGEYANYVHSLYKENIDYTIDSTHNFMFHPDVVKFPNHLKRLVGALSITFTKEEDAMLFKLKFNV